MAGLTIGVPSVTNFFAELALRPTNIIPQQIDLGTNLIPFTIDRLAGTCLDPANRTDYLVGLTRFDSDGLMRIVASQAPKRKNRFGDLKDIPAAYMRSVGAGNTAENGAALALGGNLLGGIVDNENVPLRADANANGSAGDLDSIIRDLSLFSYPGITVNDVVSDVYEKQQIVWAAYTEALKMISRLRDNREPSLVEEAKRVAASLQVMIQELLKDASHMDSIVCADDIKFKSNRRRTLLAMQLDGINLTTTRSELLGFIGDSKEAAETLKFAVLQGGVALKTATTAEDWEGAREVYELLGLGRYRYALSSETTGDDRNTIIENILIGSEDLLMAQKFLVLGSIYLNSVYMQIGKKYAPLPGNLLGFLLRPDTLRNIVKELISNGDEINERCAQTLYQIEVRRLTMIKELQRIDPDLAGKDPAAILDEMPNHPPDLLQNLAAGGLLAPAAQDFDQSGTTEHRLLATVFNFVEGDSYIRKMTIGDIKGIIDMSNENSSLGKKLEILRLLDMLNSSLIATTENYRPLGAKNYRVNQGDEKQVKLWNGAIEITDLLSKILLKVILSDTSTPAEIKSYSKRLLAVSLQNLLLSFELGLN